MYSNSLLNILFIIILEFHQIQGNIGQYTLDARIGKRYQFELFEDFNSCADLYHQEAKVVDRLIKIKMYLLEIKSRITNRTIRIQEMKALKKSIEGAKNIQKQNFEDVGKKFPSIIDFMGSIKAMFMLHYSYGLNVALAVLEGKLSYTNHLKEAKVYQVINYIKVKDLK